MLFVFVCVYQVLYEYIRRYILDIYLYIYTGGTFFFFFAGRGGGGWWPGALGNEGALPTTNNTIYIIYTTLRIFLVLLSLLLAIVCRASRGTILTGVCTDDIIYALPPAVYVFICFRPRCAWWSAERFFHS